MSKSSESITAAEFADPRWRELYLIGGVCGILMSALTILAIVIYFIWPYKPGLTSAQDIFTTLQSDPWNGLMSLDFFMIVVTVLTIPFFLALYLALHKVNDSLALLALVFGMFSCLIILPARPIAEMFDLSARYAAATTDATRSQYLAAGEALSTLFNGTAWMLYFLTFSVDLMISSILMLRARAFSRATAYLGILLNVGLLSLLAVIPSFALIATMINLATTIIGTVWNVLVARTLFQLGSVRSDPRPSPI